jgi:hypothetical protein
MTRSILGLAITLLAAGTALAQDAAKPLNPGDPLPGPFRSYVVVDERVEAKDPRNRTNKQHCLFLETDLNPGVAVFLRTVPADPNTGAAKLLKRLDGLVAEHKADRLGAFAIFLTLADDYPKDEARDERAKAVKDFAAQLKVPNVPFGLAAGKSDAVTAYSIKDDHDVSVILFNRAKVVKRWAFTADKPPADADADAILAAAKEMVK